MAAGKYGSVYMIGLMRPTEFQSIQWEAIFVSDENCVNAGDMALLPKLLPFTAPESIPLSFVLGDREIRGIPRAFRPRVVRRAVDANMEAIVVEGSNDDGLTLRAEYIEYRDFPVTEWVAFIENRGTRETPVLSRVRICDGELSGSDAALVHNNGETRSNDGFSSLKEPVAKEIALSPSDGTSCMNAFPYMRLLFREYGVNIAVGWPAKWDVSVAPSPGGVRFSAGQQRLHTVLRPGEILRTPRVNFMGFTGGESRGRNLWRRWYFRHILPRENGSPLPPKLCLHTFMAGGHPEFTGITEENQIAGIRSYLKHGLKPDIWWIDAGWYRCNYDWGHTGTWAPDPERLPNGLGPVGKLCDENGIRLLLWFEPERVRPGTELDREHPGWLLHRHDEQGNDAPDRLLNLGDPECCGWLIDRVDRLIKESHVRVYRQDFNTDALGYWEQNESENREGALENFHVQGYLHYWDELLRRNPGLLIDSCAGGGRRNDLETMRRAVPLQYTDIGLGNHPVKQKQYRAMFEWIPYFRSHTLNWDNAEGGYENGGKPVDEFAYLCAMAPALTSMIEWNDSEPLFALGRRMHPIWRRAAELMLSGDFYPLLERCGDAHGYYAVQFDDPARGCGFVEVIRNTLAEDGSVTLRLHADGGAVYDFTNALTGETSVRTAEVLREGESVSLPKRSGALCFYKKRN